MRNRGIKHVRPKCEMLSDRHRLKRVNVAIRKRQAGASVKSSNNVLEIGASASSIVALVISIVALFISINEIRNNGIVQAWSLLTATATGNAGKTEAIEILHRAGKSLENIDLSCGKMGGSENWAQVDSERFCQRPVVLAGLNVNAIDITEAAQFKGANLSGVDMPQSGLRGANFLEADVSYSHLVESDLSLAYFKEANLTSSNLNLTNMTLTNLYGAYLSSSEITSSILINSNLSFAILDKADLTSSDLTWAEAGGASFQGTKLLDANISGASFCSDGGVEKSTLFQLAKGCARGLTQSQIDQSWAWADDPPRFTSDMFSLELLPPHLCRTSARAAYYENARNTGISPTGRPDGC